MINLSEALKPGGVIGIIGGGQLGKMLAQSAKRMGYTVGILDPAAYCPAAQVSDWHIQADYSDEAALLAFAEKADVLTFEFENIDAALLKKMQKITDLPQGTDILTITQDRLKEKAFLKQAAIPVAAFEKVANKQELEQAITKIGYPSILKTVRFGYDGKGQILLTGEKDKEAAEQLILKQTCVLEAWIPFEKELSVMIVQNRKKERTVFPVSENIHRHNILHESVVPARIEKAVNEQVIEIAGKIADALDLVGTLGIEFFLDKEGTLYVNELAPRPHNSGHFTIEAASVSQFDAHILAVAGLPLPEAELLFPAVMVNILGQHMEKTTALREEKPGWSFHYYGKEDAQHNRKMGHITILTHDTAQTQSEIKNTEIWDGDLD